jgi:hypothetical protein
VPGAPPNLIRAIQLGAEDFLRKPFAQKDIQEKVEAVGCPSAPPSTTTLHPEKILQTDATPTTLHHSTPCTQTPRPPCIHAQTLAPPFTILHVHTDTRYHPAYTQRAAAVSSLWSVFVCCFCLRDCAVSRVHSLTPRTPLMRLCILVLCDAQFWIVCPWGVQS